MSDFSGESHTFSRLVLTRTPYHVFFIFSIEFLLQTPIPPDRCWQCQSPSRSRTGWNVRPRPRPAADRHQYNASLYWLNRDEKTTRAAKPPQRTAVMAVQMAAVRRSPSG